MNQKDLKWLGVCSGLFWYFNFWLYDLFQLSNFHVNFYYEISLPMLGQYFLSIVTIVMIFIVISYLWYYYFNRLTSMYWIVIFGIGKAAINFGYLWTINADYITFNTILSVITISLMSSMFIGYSIRYNNLL